nr:prohormone 4 [Hymenolepis microstoma]
MNYANDGEHRNITLANTCPETRPWPCRTGHRCLAFDFICDGEKDCADGYDEDEELCIAKQRPPVEYMVQFITKYHDWLIPDILGEGSPLILAKMLVESPTIEDYASAAHLNKEQFSNLNSVLEGVYLRKEMQLVLLGMPIGAWSELYYLFNRIITSGFVKNLEEIDE